eukprot:1143420-Pelagomonas_calceolata.AAC.2
MVHSDEDPEGKQASSQTCKWCRPRGLAESLQVLCNTQCFVHDRFPFFLSGPCRNATAAAAQLPGARVQVSAAVANEIPVFPPKHKQS